MTHSSDPITGDSSRVDEEGSAEHDVFRTKADANAAPISAAPDEDAIGDSRILDAWSICLGGLPIEQKREATPASAFAQISEAEEHALYQFDEACVVLLRADPSLLGFAFTVLATVQSFLDDCDIKSPVPLEEQLDEDQSWRSLMLSIAGHPIKQTLSQAVRDMELYLARDRISWMLDGGRTYL
jgi:hypothetical protein